MKRKLKLASLLLFTVLSLSLVACNTEETSSNTTTTQTTTTTTTTTTTDLGPFIDYAHLPENMLRLDYTKSKGFFEDGIAQVDLASGVQSCIDGDTAHFKSRVGDDTTIKVRFYGIDTPESTGDIQEWGIPAKNYCRERLMAAQENGTIVLSIPSVNYDVPQHDSTGIRYLGVVWINETVKDAPIDQLYCLNLLMVQEGFSPDKDANDERLAYLTPVFRDACLQAQKFKLHIYSDEVDVLFPNSAFTPTPVKSILDEYLYLLDNGIDPESVDEEGNNVFTFQYRNVAIEGTVAHYADNTVYIQQYDKDGGEWYSLPIFLGYNSPAMYRTINNRVNFKGTITATSAHGLQMTNVTLPIVSFGSEEESEVLAYAKDVVGTENERHVYDVTRQDLDHTNGSYYDYLYQVVRIGGLSDGALVPTGGYNNDNPGENGYTLYVTGRDDSYSFNISVPFDYRTDEGELITDYSWFVGKKLIITGAYSFYIYNGRTNYIITVGSNADFEFAA